MPSRVLLMDQLVREVERLREEAQRFILDIIRTTEGKDIRGTRMELVLTMNQARVEVLTQIRESMDQNTAILSHEYCAGHSTAQVIVPGKGIYACPSYFDPQTSNTSLNI